VCGGDFCAKRTRPTWRASRTSRPRIRTRNNNNSPILLRHGGQMEGNVIHQEYLNVLITNHFSHSGTNNFSGSSFQSDAFNSSPGQMLKILSESPPLSCTPHNSLSAI
jgi:hypothetical protein